LTARRHASGEVDWSGRISKLRGLLSGEDFGPVWPNRHRRDRGLVTP
jgi:hypothetical protein